MPKDGSLFKHILNLRFCNVHPEEKNEFKCSDHDGLFCCLCAISIHKTGNTIMQLNETMHDRNERVQETLSNINK